MNVALHLGSTPKGQGMIPPVPREDAGLRRIVTMRWILKDEERRSRPSEKVDLQPPFENRASVDCDIERSSSLPQEDAGRAGIARVECNIRDDGTRLPLEDREGPADLHVNSEPSLFISSLCPALVLSSCGAASQRPKQDSIRSGSARKAKAAVHILCSAAFSFLKRFCNPLSREPRWRARSPLHSQSVARAEEMLGAGGRSETANL